MAAGATVIKLGLWPATVQFAGHARLLSLSGVPYRAELSSRVVCCSVWGDGQGSRTSSFPKSGTPAHAVGPTVHRSECQQSAKCQQLMTALKYVMLLQRDVPAAVQFYSKGLGLHVRASTDRWAELGLREAHHTGAQSC